MRWDRSRLRGRSQRRCQKHENHACQDRSDNGGDELRYGLRHRMAAALRLRRRLIGFGCPIEMDGEVDVVVVEQRAQGNSKRLWDKPFASPSR